MATPLTRALLGAMYSEGQPSGFVFWFLELIALGCVLVAIEGRFAIGEVASGLRWLAAGLIVGVVGFYRPQINARIQSHRKHSPMASTAIVAILAALIAGSAWWFLVEGRTPPTAASPMFVTVENVRPFGNTFEKAKQPVFHPEFLNSGPVPLDGVRVNVTLQVLAALPTEPWPFDSSNDEKLPRLPANGGKRHVERIGNELTQAVVDALNRKTLHYYVFVRIYDDSEAKQHSDSCFVFNPDRGRTGTYTGDPDWVFDRCDKGIATVPASSGSGFSPEAIADGERHMREWRASRFKPPTTFRPK